MITNILFSGSLKTFAGAKIFVHYNGLFVLTGLCCSNFYCINYWVIIQFFKMVLHMIGLWVNLLQLVYVSLKWDSWSLLSNSLSYFQMFHCNRLWSKTWLELIFTLSNFALLASQSCQNYEFVRFLTMHRKIRLLYRYLTQLRQMQFFANLVWLWIFSSFYEYMWIMNEAKENCQT